MWLCLPPSGCGYESWESAFPWLPFIPSILNFLHYQLALYSALIFTCFERFLFALKVHLCGYLLMGCTCILLLLEHSPPLYHVYAAMTGFLWTRIFSELQFLKALWRDLLERQSIYIAKLVATCAVSLVILEFLVWPTDTYMVQCPRNDQLKSIV